MPSLCETGVPPGGGSGGCAVCEPDTQDSCKQAGLFAICAESDPKNAFNQYKAAVI